MKKILIAVVAIVIVLFFGIFSLSQCSSSADYDQLVGAYICDSGTKGRGTAEELSAMEDADSYAVFVCWKRTADSEKNLPGMALKEEADSENADSTTLNAGSNTYYDSYHLNIVGPENGYSSTYEQVFDPTGYYSIFDVRHNELTAGSDDVEKYISVFSVAKKDIDDSEEITLNSWQLSGPIRIDTSEIIHVQSIDELASVLEDE